MSRCQAITVGNTGDDKALHFQAALVIVLTSCYVRRRGAVIRSTVDQRRLRREIGSRMAATLCCNSSPDASSSVVLTPRYFDPVCNPDTTPSVPAVASWLADLVADSTDRRQSAATDQWPSTALSRQR